MSDIFISYASEDRERITPLVGLLERRGWSVWWDRTIVSSKTFEEFIEATPDEFIEAALDRTRCVIVVWSHASVVPQWVRSEAAKGLQRGVLVSVQFDAVEIPSEFRQIQTVQLIGWTGEEDHQEVRKLLSSISEILGERFFPPEQETTPLSEVPKERPIEEPPPEAFTNSIGMKFVRIPAGTFEMGSPLDEPGRRDDERQHRVTITKPFYLQTTEVTQGQWKRVMGNNPSHFKDRGDDCPVESVSWNDVQRFIWRLNQMEGTDKYRLPTEAEWEYACRAGTTTPFHTGRNISTDQANYDGRNPMPGRPKGKYRCRPLRVESFAANAWGLYDMHGNVFEWCEDRYGEYPEGDVTDPKGPSSGNPRVLRGGSWNGGARYARSASRSWYYQDDRLNYDGFRLAKDF